MFNLTFRASTQDVCETHPSFLRFPYTAATLYWAVMRVETFPCGAVFVNNAYRPHFSGKFHFDGHMLTFPNASLSLSSNNLASQYVIFKST